MRCETFRHGYARRSREAEPRTPRVCESAREARARPSERAAASPRHARRTRSREGVQVRVTLAAAHPLLCVPTKADYNLKVAVCLWCLDDCARSPATSCAALPPGRSRCSPERNAHPRTPNRFQPMLASARWARGDATGAEVSAWSMPLKLSSSLHARVRQCCLWWHACSCKRAAGERVLDCSQHWDSTVGGNSPS